ncbi:MAG: hypothetical protein JWN70_2317 [Planctomycetaceae bacterium]|nr:hypothetical protein [Planctomycetaceae bacterium]
MIRARLCSQTSIDLKRPGQCAFTLVELLIVISLLLILSSLTLAIFNSTSEADRIRSSARQLQSALLGARDRAIHAKLPRGLRLLLQDTNDPTAPAAHVVTGMVYIGAEDYWTSGQFVFQYPDFSIPAIGHVENQANDGIAELQQFVVLRGTNTDWSLLYAQGLIETGSRIEIPRNSGEWYTVDVSLLKNPPAGAPPGDYLVLPRNGYRKQINVPSLTYRLELKPTVLAGQEPLRLSSGIVVNLDRSAIPASWYTAGVPKRTYFNYATVPPSPKSLDIMFSPRGWAADSASTPISPFGVIHFYLSSQEDADLDRDPADAKSGEKLILSFFPRTGNVATFPVDITDGGTGVAIDPFHYAKLGGTAGR